jgi:hypothetical protein
MVSGSVVRAIVSAETANEIVLVGLRAPFVNRSMFNVAVTG